MKRGDYAKKHLPKDASPARALREPVQRFASGFTPGTKRAGAGTSCPHNPKFH